MADSSTAIRTVRLFVASAGNDFMIDIARIFAEGFERVGVSCQLAIDEIPSKHANDCLQLVVAPHEFFPLFLARHSAPGQQHELTRHLWVSTSSSLEANGSSSRRRTPVRVAASSTSASTEFRSSVGVAFAPCTLPSGTRACSKQRRPWTRSTGQLTYCSWATTRRGAKSFFRAMPTFLRLISAGSFSPT